MNLLHQAGLQCGTIEHIKTASNELDKSCIFLNVMEILRINQSTERHLETKTSGNKRQPVHLATKNNPRSCYALPLFIHLDIRWQHF
uniref:Uncharacterized protein n=1 Tax=Rhizophora mucronata TaxID=61149 RepID=A0A2P2P3P1_RHIMU